jgi:hypothetical protein
VRVWIWRASTSCSGCGSTGCPPGSSTRTPADPALRRQVEDEPRPLPVALAAQARSLLAELPSSGLAEDRVALLHSQLTALDCNARRLAGEPVGFVDEVKAYFGVDIALGDESDYAAAHEELAALLPGSGPLAERYAAYRTPTSARPDRLDGLVRDLSSALRDVVRTGTGCRRGRRSSIRSSPTSRGAGSTTTSAGSGPGSRSTPTCRTGSPSCRTWSRTRHIPGTTPSTAARSAAWSVPAAGWSTRCSWSTRRSA